MTQIADSAKQMDDAEISVSFKMKGINATRFVRFMNDQNLQLVSEAARKLILDRLAQIEQNGAAQEATR